MPTSPPSLCTSHGCGTLVYGGGRCAEHRKEVRRESDVRRPQAHLRGYDHEWRATRRAYLDAHPMCECEECALLPIWQRPPATDVDHIDRLGPNGPRGHDWDNLQALTHAHHARLTARYDGGFGREKRARD